MASTTDFDMVGLGQTLRGARQQREMTLGELATEAGVSSGLISQLERGQGNPSFLTLRRLAEALRLPVAHFVQGPPIAGMLVRAHERARLHLPDSGLVYELLTPGLQGRLEVLRTQVPAGWSNQDRPFSHEGEECVHVLDGRLEVTVGVDGFELEVGDSLTYDASIPHWYLNPTEEPAVLLGAVTPPSF